MSLCGPEAAAAAAKAAFSWRQTRGWKTERNWPSNIIISRNSSLGYDNSNRANNYLLSPSLSVILTLLSNVSRRAKVAAAAAAFTLSASI